MSMAPGKTPARRGHSANHRVRSVRQCRLGVAYHLRRAERGEISLAEAKGFAAVYRQLSELLMAEKTLQHAGILDITADEHPDGPDEALEPRDEDVRRHVAEKAKLKITVGGQEVEIQVDGPAAMIEAIRQLALAAPLLAAPVDEPEGDGSGS